MWQLYKLKDDLINMSYYHLRPLPPIYTSHQELSFTHCIIDNREGSFSSRASIGVWDSELGFFSLSWGSHLDIFRKPFLFGVLNIFDSLYFIIIIFNHLKNSSRNSQFPLYQRWQIFSKNHLRLISKCIYMFILY